jgi:2-polyprenyl-3-methyl-5-hydroxy-6-metoxy-1,4-benzoquinol methylase
MKLDTVKLKLYYDFILTQVYTEPESEYHKITTQEIYDLMIKPLKLKKTANILDVGCGPGYFLDIMKKNKYKNAVGTTLSKEDIKICEDKGHTVRREDISFLTDKDESLDFIFCRQVLEHSPFPYITLLEYNRVLKQGAKIYIETPQPDCVRNHEANPNHYSVLTDRMLMNLIVRAGFDIETSNNLESTALDKKTKEQFIEKSYGIVAVKKRPIDVK